MYIFVKKNCKMSKKIVKTLDIALFFVYNIYMVSYIFAKYIKNWVFYMDQQKIDMYIMTNQKYFPEEKIVYLKDKLRTIDEEKFSLASTVELKDPTTILLVSIFLGTLGIDRFMIGDTGMGILKLLTAGCCGILTIVDWFSIQKKTKDLNFNKLMALI